MEVEDVKANRSKKEMLELSLFEKKFITEGNDKADEPAREIARLGRRKHGAGESNPDSGGMRRNSCSIAICSWLALSGGGMERW